MDTAVTTQMEQYDWLDENYQALTGLRAQLMHQYVKEGMTKSRAAHRASDEIASNLMNPPKTGQELDTWLGRAMQNVRYGKGHSNGNGNGHHKVKASDILTANTVDFSIPDGLTPPSEAIPKTARWAPVIAILRDLAVDEWKALMFKTQRDAQTVSSVLSYHSRHTLNCAAAGWKFKSKTDKDNPLLVWITKKKS